MTDVPPVLSPATQASVQNLARAKSDLAAWTQNLENALAEDLAADPPRLTADQAAAIAQANDIKPPKAPKPKEEPEAANQQQQQKAAAPPEKTEPPKPGTDKDDDDKKAAPAPPAHKPEPDRRPPPPTGRR